MTPPPDAPTAVIALGGNALAPAGENSTIYDQFRHTRESLGPIVDLALRGWNVCVVHGNGPQVGDELVRNELAREEANPLPLGVLVAETTGRTRGEDRWAGQRAPSGRQPGAPGGTRVERDQAARRARHHRHRLRRWR